jgi:hypothetical protein
MRCPNCHHEATLIDAKKGQWQCLSEEEACYSMRWVELPRNGIHILPEDMRIFFTASQTSKAS